MASTARGIEKPNLRGRAPTPPSERTIQIVFEPKWKFRSSEPTHYQVQNGAPPDMYTRSNPLALPRVCHQIREETLGMSHALNNFGFPIMLEDTPLSPQSGIRAPNKAIERIRGTDVLCMWLRQRTPDMNRAMGGITIDIGKQEPWTRRLMNKAEPEIMAGRLRDMRDNLSFITPIGGSLSVRLSSNRKVHTADVLIQFCLPLHDREALRTVVEETMKPH